MSTIIIQASFETKLKTWADSQSPPLPISFENVSFIKPADGSPYLECFLIPNVTLNRQVSADKKTLLGFFQVNCWAQNGTGMHAGRQIAESIVNLFPVIPKTGSVSVDTTPSVGKPLRDQSGWIVVPVLIKYRYEGSV